MLGVNSAAPNGLSPGTSALSKRSVRPLQSRLVMALVPGPRQWFIILDCK